MEVKSGRVLDRLPAEEPCQGALFTSYAFNPDFFEKHVLRTVLRLTSDPVEQAERYHHEARRALQETPVVAIVDAAERQPGRRLPFDLLEVSDVVFHPKTTLLLYRKFAHLMIGSGNLTYSGYGKNAELFLCTKLAYDQSADVALLTAFDQHLDRLGSLVRRSGTQLKSFRDELQRRLPSGAPDTRSPQPLALLDSMTGPIIEQFAALLPDNALIESIGMLAPFYERDDAERDEASELDATSVFGALSRRTARNAVLDVGVAWDNPRMNATGDSELEKGLGRIWTWAYEDDGVRGLEHVVPTGIGTRMLSYTDEAGQGRRRRIDEAREDIEQGRLWMQLPPITYAPRNAIKAAGNHFSKVRLWLHPATRLVDGQPVYRPLHAKLLIVGYRSGRSRGTLVLMGSPNMSRRALLMKAGRGHQGNVEVALAFRLDSIKSLRDFVPALVLVDAPESTFELQEREFPDPGSNYALAIDEAVHDPEARTLVVSWSDQAAGLPAWRLTYGGRPLAESDSPPVSPVKVDEFALKPTTAEVVLHVGDSEYSAPILVTDLVALPATAAGPGLGLGELLLLLGRRIGAERAVRIAGDRGAAGTGENGELHAFFGEGFGPADVFRAWWSVAEDLKQPDLSAQAFRLRLEGALGAGAAWTCMVDAAAKKTIPVEQIWFYGAELLRTLDEVEFSPADDRKTKALSKFRARIRKDLREIGFEAGNRPWVKRILTFYGATET